MFFFDILLVGSLSIVLRKKPSEWLVKENYFMDVRLYYEQVKFLIGLTATVSSLSRFSPIFVHVLKVKLNFQIVRLLLIVVIRPILPKIKSSFLLLTVERLST